MFDAIIYFIFSKTYLFVATVFGVKIYFLLTSEYRSRSLSKFFYYNYINLILTSNPKRYRYKKLQNNLTVAILFLVMIQVVFFSILYNIFSS